MQEHERGLGGWQAQWHAFPALLLVTSGALAAIADLAQGLDIDAERMRSNLEVAQGLIMTEAVTMALDAKLGQQRGERSSSRKPAARRSPPSGISTASWPKTRA